VALELGPRLSDELYLSSLANDGEKFAQAAEKDLGAEVPSCPGWTAAELVWHLTEAHYFWRSIAEGALQDYKQVDDIPRPPDHELVDMYRSNLALTVDVLRRTDRETSVWTWSPEKNVAWIRRRMAHETAVHRWDAQTAMGHPADIEKELAVDGIDEYLEFFVDLSQPEDPPETSLHLHATDIEGEWFVELRDGRMTARRAHEKGEVAVRGKASDLLLLLWGRIPEARVDVHGDRADLFAFLQLSDLT
jgi:uncharacterized protein (TIGR03083 family)